MDAQRIHLVRLAVQHLADGLQPQAKFAQKQDPLKAILIAAGVGALLMGLVVVIARSGVQSVEREIRE